MTREEIMSLGLTKERKEAYTNWCIVMNRLKKSTDVETIKDKTSAEIWIDALIQRTNKAAEAKAKKEAKKAIKEAETKRINEVVLFAKEAGLSVQDIINAVMVAAKAKYNEKIEAEIAELQNRMNEKLKMLENSKM